MQAQQEPNIQNQRSNIRCKVLKTDKSKLVSIKFTNLIITKQRGSKDVEKHDIVIKIIEGAAKTRQDIF